LEKAFAGKGLYTFAPGVADVRLK